MNRLKNFEEQPELPLGDQTIIPLMCMSSIEPVKVRPGFINDFSNLKFLDQTFNLNFSSFKKDENSPSFLTFLISCLSMPMLPEFLSAVFTNVETQEAKNFLTRPLLKFTPFKKAILLFEPRPYSLKEFDKVVVDWRKSFEEIK